MAARVLTAGPEDWARVATHVYDRRFVDLGLTAVELVDRAGPGLSIGVVSLIENNRQASYAMRTILALCRGLGWTSDSVQRIIRGGEPVVIEAETSTAEPRRTLTERVAEIERLVAMLLEEKEAEESAAAEEHDPEPQPNG